MFKKSKNILVAALALFSIFFINGCLTTSESATEAVVLTDDFDIDVTTVMELEVAAATASSFEEAKGFVPERVIDGDLTTNWAADGENWITLDLGAAKKVAYLEIAFKKGNERKYGVMVEGSVDGENFMPMSEKLKNSGKSEDLEMFEVVNKEVQFVKVTFFPSSSSSWNNVFEIKAYGL